MTQFIFGNYAHAPDSVAFTGLTRTYIDAPNGKHKLLRLQMNCKGKLIGRGPNPRADLFGQLNFLQAAYSGGGGQNARMIDDNGGTMFFLDNGLAIGGVVVTNPVSHEEITGAESVTYLRYTFGLQADFFFATGAEVLNFQETVSFSDNWGRPLCVERVPAVGQPIIQQVTEASFYHATQSGSMTTVGPNPAPMDPLWPNNLRGQDGSVSVSYDSPLMIRGVPVEYSVKWAYQFVSTTPLVGLPNIMG
ncbi:hypothetical protein [Schlesneria paludicola]|uniref:hypothetical protein n=1 Tax=Schlesneria paludicola TaxID=360056 RepID=UPI00029AF115|nr:hypothetical protein [Schlesneria paludicola]